MKRGAVVYVTAGGGANAAGFGSGWTVWVDQNGNGIQDAGEATIRSHAAFAAGTTIADGTTTRVGFGGSGFQIPALLRTLKVCNSASGPLGYALQVLPNGLSDVAINVPCP